MPSFVAHPPYSTLLAAVTCRQAEQRERANTRTRTETHIDPTVNTLPNARAVKSFHSAGGLAVGGQSSLGSAGWDSGASPPRE